MLRGGLKPTLWTLDTLGKLTLILAPKTELSRALGTPWDGGILSVFSVRKLSLKWLDRFSNS